MNNEILYCEYEDCNRKLKIHDLSCKCGKIFCKFHKFPEQHNCNYDYKERKNNEEKIQNMKCLPKKI